MERSTAVEEPFASDPDFWSAVRCSADAAVTLVAVAVLTATLGTVWAFGFAVPSALLGYAAVRGRGSSRRSRVAFPDRATWRDAERSAVAAAFLPALLRRHPR